MVSPLTGIRVVEAANFLAVPSCGALMADMGADVMKIEPLEGDQYRHETRPMDFDYQFPINYAFELDNRGKRSISLDLRNDGAAEVVGRLVEGADVFTTNLLPERLERFRLRYEDLSARNDRLIYLAFNGYGPKGPDKDRLGFDYTAFWTRSGAMSLYGEPGGPPVNLRPGVGDHSISPLLLAGVLSAILLRQKTGRGMKVTSSLLNMGLWVIGADVQRALVARQNPIKYSRKAVPNPLQNTYQTRDGHWLNVVMVHSDANWAKFCKALGREDLTANPKYTSIEDRRRNIRELVAELDRIFGSKTLEELTPGLDAQKIIWARMQQILDVMDDPQSRANGYFTSLEHPTHGSYETLQTPIKFSAGEIGAKKAAPEAGQHTEEVLLEAGYSWEEINGLRDAGVIL